MLSLYDAQAFSLKKQNLLLAFILGTLMFVLFALAATSLENNFFLISLIKRYFFMPEQNLNLLITGGQFLQTFKNPLFWALLFQKTLLVGSFFCFFTLMFFSFNLITAKKKLFNQPPQFTLQFLLITSLKLIALMLPLFLFLSGVYYEITKSVFLFFSSIFRKTNPVYSFPFSSSQISLILLIALSYFFYIILLFSNHFSFKSLLDCRPIFRNFPIFVELIVKCFLSFWISLTVLIVNCILFAQLDSDLFTLYILFLYSSLALSFKEVRLTLTLPFLATILISLGVHQHFEHIQFIQQFSILLKYVLMYYLIFFIWFCFWGNIAHLFTAAAFAIHFNKSPATDAKTREASNLRPIEQLYREYLKDHKNDNQENYFDAPLSDQPQEDDQ